MPAQTELLRDGRVLLLNYTNPMTTADLQQALNELHDVCTVASAPIHTITDLSTITNLPPKIVSFLRYNPYSPFKNPNTGTFIVIVRSRVVGTIVNTLASLARGFDIRSVATLKDAWAEIDHILEAEIQV
jgi:hypothetical protein